jgi:hypothetical protein
MKVLNDIAENNFSEIDRARGISHHLRKKVAENM